MDNNYEYSEYNDEKNTIPWKRIILIVLMLIAVVVIALFVLRGCSKDSLSESMIKASKNYYEENPDMLPTEPGECYIMTLQQMIDEEIISDKDFETCDTENTYVKVCYLESKTYHYTTVLSCENEMTDFGMWTDGTEADLIADKTDVRFKFLGEELSLGTKYYYPNNLEDVSKVVEYYAASPAGEYTGKENEATGYKWYTKSTSNVYWNNGNYSSTQPSGYTKKGASTTKTAYTDKEPTNTSYRTIKSGVSLYRTQYIARPMDFYCYATGDENSVIKSKEPCHGDFPNLVRIAYTCDGTTEVDRETPCGEYSDWSTTACKSSTLNGIKCENVTGYQYTDTLWKWYKTVETNKYYPSGNSNASLEKTYYLTSPVDGAIKDDSTKATVYNFYKLEEVENEDATVKEWLEVTDDYVFEDELIEKFKELEYDVETLKDINDNETLRYRLKLQYRDIKE